VQGKKFLAIVNLTTVAALVVALALGWVQGRQTIVVAVLSLVILNAAAVVGLYLRKK
jgi:hypothetical protein